MYFIFIYVLCVVFFGILTFKWVLSTVYITFANVLLCVFICYLFLFLF